MKVAIALLTKDKPELTRQSIVPLLQPDKFDLFWIDGSKTDDGLNYLQTFGGNPSHPNYHLFANVRGGAGAGIVFALTEMLKNEEYTHVGLCEQDVVLPMDWFDNTLNLFDVGKSDGLSVGAASARCYRDRVLFQRDSYAVCHNLGAGHIVFTREAAQLALNNFRSAWTTDNRRIFSQVAGVDIAPFWAFRGGQHPLVADWGWDAMLAKHGLASLALTPSNAEMIGQDPPLAEQGLEIVKTPVEERMDGLGFARYRSALGWIRAGELQINVETTFQFCSDMGGWVYLPHQLHMLGGRFVGNWRFKEARANGEFTWVSASEPVEHGQVLTADNSTTAGFEVPVYGMATLLVSGGKTGGQIIVEDTHSGYRVDPFVAPEGAEQTAMVIPLPAGASYRTIRVTMPTPGCCFYRLVTTEQQPVYSGQTFDHSILPLPV